MSPRITRSDLAGFTGLPVDAAEACQRALAAREETRQRLAENEEITVPVWHLLWQHARTDSALARELVSRELGPEQRAEVTKSEKRVAVLRDFIDHNVLSRAEQETLAARPRAAEHLLEQNWTEKELRKPAALAAKGLPLLREIALAPDGTFSVEEIGDLLRTLDDWGPTKERSEKARMLRIILGRNPGVSDGIDSEDVVTALAGSANLSAEEADRIAGVVDGICLLTAAQLQDRKFQMLALLANPRCPMRTVTAVSQVAAEGSDIGAAARRRVGRPEITGPFTEVADGETLDWLITRSRPSNGNFGFRRGRPLELIELIVNPHLSEEQRSIVSEAVQTDVEEALVNLHRDRIRAMSDDFTVDPEPAPRRTRRRWGTPEGQAMLVSYAYEHLGADPARWETLVGLLPDFEGSFTELVDLAANI